jgi:hypothetical protein
MQLIEGGDSGHDAKDFHQPPHRTHDRAPFPHTFASKACRMTTPCRFWKLDRLARSLRALITISGLAQVPMTSSSHAKSLGQLVSLPNCY